MMVWPARSDLAHHILLRKTQLSDIHCINFSACKNGALDPIWQADSTPNGTPFSYLCSHYLTSNNL